MLSAFILKTWPIWLDVSIIVWAIIFKDALIKLTKDLFGGFFGIPPKDETDKKEDK